MTETKALLCISLLIECPECGDVMDLLNPEMGLNDEGEMLDQACPSKGVWMDSHSRFSETITCTGCKTDIHVKRIEW